MAIDLLASSSGPLVSASEFFSFYTGLLSDVCCISSVDPPGWCFVVFGCLLIRFSTFHACTGSGYWRQHSGCDFLFMVATCLGVSVADSDLLGGGRSEGCAPYVRRVCGKITQVQSLPWGSVHAAKFTMHWRRQRLYRVFLLVWAIVGFQRPRSMSMSRHWEYTRR